MGERKSILLRLDPSVHDALAHWAADELRSTNSQIEFLLRRALSDAGRAPSARPIPKRGRPKKQPGPPGAGPGPEEDGNEQDGGPESYEARSAAEADRG
jgi:hypothetical protein